MKKKPVISVVIPVERETKYLKEALDCYSKQTYQNFEVIIASSAKFSNSYSFVRVLVEKELTGDVASKRNQILKFGRGEIFVFNDDDVFIPPDYLANIVKKLKDQEVLAACGPLLTPHSDSFLQKASGAIWESYFGSLGAGVYRNRKMARRVVYDYPAANLIVRREVFKAVGGFEKGLYPGEDTKFCLLVFNKFKKGIFYDPELFVYHHRKPLFKGHLEQIGRYGRQRGWFTLSYPETSFKIRYFFPSIFLLYIAVMPLVIFLDFRLTNNIVGFYLLPLMIYGILIIMEGCMVVCQKGPLLAPAAIIGIVVTHLYYGYRFLESFIGKIIKKIREFFKLLRKP